MFERRQHFLAEFDWIRTGLMFEPRGHDMMSGSILYPPTRPDCDVGILFIETSGLPADVRPRHDRHGHDRDRERADPARRLRDFSDSTRRPASSRRAMRRTAPSSKACASPTCRPFSTARTMRSTSTASARSRVDVAYGGNFYAIVEPQPLYSDLADVNPSDILRWSPKLRTAFNARHEIAHPDNPAIDRLTHVLWTGEPQTPGGSARNAVFYGDKAIDRSPCGTGTSARMAHLAAQGRARSRARRSCTRASSARPSRAASKGATKVGNLDAIIPSIEGWARVTGFNTIVDRRPRSVRARLPGRRPLAREPPIIPGP